MASKTQEAKVKISADISQFNGEIKSANSTLTTLRSELKLNKAQMDATGQSTELLAQRQEILAREAQASEQKIQALANKLEATRSAYGSASTEAQKLETQLNNARTAHVKIEAEMDSVKSAAKQMESGLDTLGDSAKELKSDIDVADIAIGNMAADMAGNAIQSVAGLEESTRQYRSEQAKLAAVAQDSGADLDALKGSYEDLYAITADETLASTAALNMSAMGMSVQQQESIIKSATGAWTRFGDSIQIDGLLESINESTGETAQVTGTLADALNWATWVTNDQWSAALSGSSKAQAAFNKGVKDGMSVEDAFNEALAACADTQERQEITLSALDTAYGSVAEAYQETNANAIAANEAQSKMNDSMAQLGDAVAPAATAGLNVAADALSWVANNLNTILPIAAGLIPIVAGLWIAFNGASVIQGVTGAFAALNAVMKANPILLIVSLIAGLVVALVGLYNSNETVRNAINAAWSGIQAAVGSVVGWFTGTALPAIQGFIGGVVGFFTGLWTNIQTIWNTICNVVQVAIMFLGEIFNLGIQILLTPWNFIWNNFGTTITSAWNFISSAVSSGISFVSGIISSVLSTISGIWSSIWGAISGVASSIWSVIVSIVTAYINTAKSVISSVLGAISSVWSSIWGVISSTASSIWRGISSTISSIVNGIKSTISSVFNAVKSTVSSVWNSIKSAIETPIKAARDTVTSVIDRIKSAFNFSWSLPKLKLPHLSITGSFSINPPSVPSFGISWYADGGIMMKPTMFGFDGSNAMVGGEAGPEAILPIERLQGFIDTAFLRNMPFGWADRLADAIDNLADRPVSVEIDGKQVAKTTASHADRVNGSRQKLIKRGVSLA